MIRKKARRKVRRKKARAPKRTTLFVDISATNKQWLNALCSNQIGRVSKSTAIEKILYGLRTDKSLLNKIGFVSSL